MNIIKQASYNNKDYAIEGREHVFRGFIQVEKVSLRHRLFAQDGSTPEKRGSYYTSGEEKLALFVRDAASRIFGDQIAPRVTLRPDEKAQRWLLAISASDRAGLLYLVARVLARHHLSVQLAKISTLGERVEDMFLLQGAQLQHNKTQLAIEQELLDVLEPQ